MPHDPLNSVASSAADIPAKLGQSSFTSECIPMAVTSGCAGLVLGVSVMLVVWYKCQRERDGLERRCKQLQKESETRKDKEKDNEARMVDMQQKQKSGLEETINQINNQLEKVKTDKEENKKTLQWTFVPNLKKSDLNQTCCFPGWSQEISPPQPVIAMVGEDVVLPCQLEPPADAFSMTMEWGRPDLDPRFVHVWHDGQELLSDKNDAYKGRTSLSISKLKRGDISLKLSTVKISDNGMYKCYIPKLSKEYFVELLVGAVSSPAISLAGLHKASSGVVLDCESRGWYPEPEVLWLDAEGNLLSAGPTETVRGPDDLYTVSSRVTVEKRHSNSFTCRVQQKNTNQTRETHITVPGFLRVSI
ncbi:butyrophilin-like protein 10 [Anoplopoma fimbria]|uniref:butyrophilin-like protein 10 n=1 Tax=Anoplopoma fimbria TaxID=229290 RepID=UPI0023EAF5A4|nr:butyrophilin-like protein 10 [Anoplopoma fimbria]